jgi:O-antigen/teichoic acid export membrane protein
MQREKEKFPSSKYLKLLSDTGIFVIGNFLAKLILYFMLPFYTSVMTAEVYGTAELLNNLSDMLFPIVTLSIYEAVFRFAVDRDQNLNALLYESTALLSKLFLGLFVVVLLVQHFMRYAFTFELFFVLLTLSFRMLFANYARGSGYTKCFSLSGVVNALAIAGFSWLFLVHFNLGVKGYLLALGCAHITSILTLFIGAHIPRRILARERDRDLLMSMLHFSVPLILNNIAWWVTSISGRYIVLFSYGAAMAGLYTAANKLPAVISVVSQVFQQAWQLNSAQEYQNEDYNKFFENVWKLYLVFIFLFGSIVVATTPMLAQITLKNEFYNARFYIPMMMLAVIISSLSAFFGSLIIVYKKTKIAMRGMLLGAIVNLLVAIFLVRPLGVWGVLIASILCYLIILMHRMLYIKKRFPMNIHLEIMIPLFLMLVVEVILMSFDCMTCQWIGGMLCIVMFVYSIIHFRTVWKSLINKVKKYINK